MSYTATTNTVPVPGHKVPDLPIDSTGNRPLNIQRLNLFIVISEEVVPLEKANSLLLQHNFPDFKNRQNIYAVNVCIPFQPNEYGAIYFVKN